MSPEEPITAFTSLDMCTTNFRRAAGAGLVGTNTIRQNFSREGGFDYIVAHGGTITEAVATGKQICPYPLPGNTLLRQDDRRAGCFPADPETAMTRETNPLLMYVTETRAARPRRLPAAVHSLSLNLLPCLSSSTLFSQHHQEAWHRVAP